MPPPLPESIRKLLVEVPDPTIRWRIEREVIFREEKIRQLEGFIRELEEQLRSVYRTNN